MPGSMFAADLQYPDLSRYETTEQKLSAVQNYLFLLLETLRYTLRNLSMEDNFNQAELQGWVDGLEIEPKTVVTETVITDELYGDYGDIADLTVNELRTDYQRAARYLAGNTANLDYLHIHDEEISFITGVVKLDANDAPLTEQLHHGTRYFWWKDATHERMTSLEDTGLPVVVYQYDEQVKGHFYFIEETAGNGQTYKVPVLKLGYGSDAGGVNGVSKLIKHASGLELSYVTQNGTQLGMYQRNEGYLDLVGMRKPTLLDFTDWDSGTFREMLDGNVGGACFVDFGDDGNPCRIRDWVGHETEIRWNHSFTPVAYIESSGTQWIDTGFTADQDTSIEIDYMPTALSGDRAVFGARVSGSSRDCELHFYNTSNVFPGYGKNTDIKSAWGTLEANTRVLFKQQKAGVYKDGTLIYTHAAATFTTPYALTLFGLRNNSATPTWLMSMKLYRCKIWDDGTLARDFIPAVTDGGVACLYDQVSGELFYNGGSGSFAAGPAV